VGSGNIALSIGLHSAQWAVIHHYNAFCSLDFLHIRHPAGLITAIHAFAPLVTHFSFPAYLVLPMVPVLQKGMTRIDGLPGDMAFPSTLQMLLLHDTCLHSGGYFDLSGLQEDSRVVLVE
jgi:hypothetical protein